jgi:hypothetical protein
MLYIGTEDGIYRWNQGAPWPIFHALQGRRIVSLSAAPGGYMAALDDGSRVWESSNNGLDWREVPLPETVARPTAMQVVGGARPDLVLALAGPLGLVRRPFGQVEEAQPPAPLELMRRWAPGLFGRPPRRPARRDGGVIVAEPAPAPPGSPRPRGWQTLAAPSVGVASALNGVTALEVTADAERSWFATVAGAGLWRSADAGASWTRCEGLPAEVYAVRAEGDLLAAGTALGVWLSQDGGSSWTPHGSGLEQASRVKAVAIKPGDPKRLLAGAAADASGNGVPSFALFESKDGGNSWVHVTRGFPVDLEGDAIIDIRHDPGDPDFAVAALASGEMWKTPTDGLWWEPLARQIHGARALCAVV